MRMRVWVIVVAACVLAWGSAAEEPEWSVGVASVKITPQKPIPLAGYAARTAPFEGVDTDIFAKALALRDAGGHRAVLVTMDLCIMPKDVAEDVRRRIMDKGSLEEGAVVLNLSHTHSGPAVSLDTGGEGNVNPRSEGVAEYTRWLQDRLVEVAGEALGKLEPAKLSYGTGVANFVMNRRQFTDRGVILGVNPRGLVNREVPVLKIDGEDGKTRAVLFGYACHNTTIPSKHMNVNGDYTGYAKQYVQKNLPGVEAMFVQGCGGDANPYERRSVEDAMAHGEELGKEVLRVVGDAKAMTAVHGPLGFAEVEAELPLQTPPRQTLEAIAGKKSGNDKASAQEMLHLLDRGEKLSATYKAPVVAWQLGKDLTFIGLPNEVVVGYVQDLERAVGPLRLWVAGYCNEVTGYVPTRRILSEGGYETRGLYTGVGWFAPEVEDALVGAGKEAAVKAGRARGRPEAQNPQAKPEARKPAGKSETRNPKSESSPKPE